MATVLYTPDAVFSLRHTPSWLLLAGSSGLVNALAFLACEQYVTHVTGAATRLGTTWPQAILAAEYAVVVLCFIAGATASVLPLQARTLRNRRPLWAAPLVVVAGVLIGVALAGQAGAFGPFGGAEAVADPSFILLSLLAFVSGLQNAAVATSTGLAVRSTHLTGPATDLGIHLGVAWYTAGEERRAAIRGAALRGGKIFAFVVGAVLSLPLSASCGYLAFFVPAICILIAAGLSFAPDWYASESPAREEASVVRATPN